jgi:hypothetical protein
LERPTTLSLHTEITTSKEHKRKDLLWFFAIALILLLLSSIPHWAGYAAQTNDLVFRGAYFDEGDYAVHISMMRAGYMGDWAYQMRFSSERHHPAYLRMFYIILGHISKWISLPVEITFEVARWVFGLGAMFAIYRLCQRVSMPSPNPSTALRASLGEGWVGAKYARAAFLLAALGSGLGWLQLMLGAPLQSIPPIDFWLIDAYVFFGISLFPAFSFTLMLMAAALTLYLNYLESNLRSPKRYPELAVPRTCGSGQVSHWRARGTNGAEGLPDFGPSAEKSSSARWQKILWISLMAVTCQVVNPIAFAVIDMAMAGATLFHWWHNRKFVWDHVLALSVIAVAQIPLLIYNFIILSRDPIWSQFTTQNQTLSPPPSFYFWGFALFWPFAIYGMVRALQMRTPAWGAILAWTLSGFALAYLPVFIQRRFLLGITIPLGILAIDGLIELLKRLEAKIPSLLKRENLIIFSYIVFTSLSSIYLILGSSLYVQAHPKDVFYPRDLEAALQWLDQNAAPNEVVLGDVETGQLTGQRTRLIAYVAHDMETLYFKNKKAMMQAYFKNSAPTNWLEGTSAKWVVYGPYEQAISKSFQPSDSLKLVYENNTVKVYEVKSR